MVSSSSKAPVYDLTLSDDVVDRDTVSPPITLHAQVIDLTDTSGEVFDDVDSRPTVPPVLSASPTVLPAFLLIQPLSLYWKMIINNKINTYPAGRPILRPRDTVVTTSNGLHGAITSTMGDFYSLTMILDCQGYVNDNIIDAFLQTLDKAVRKAAPAKPTRYVFLSTYAARKLKKAAEDTEARQQLQRILDKHGVNPANLKKVKNIHFPIHIATGAGHWVLAIWHPHRAGMTWYDSLALTEGPRSRFNQIT